MKVGLIGTVLLTAGLASSQSMVEHAAAVAGGTAGAAGGKKVSEGITKIFGKVNAITGAAASDKEKKAPSEPLLKVGAPEAPPEPGKPGFRPPAPARRASAQTASVDIPAGPAVASQPPVGMPISSMPPAPPPPPTPDTIASIQAGTSREQVVSSLGTPSSKISMFEDGRLVEIYRYSNSGSTVGAVRMANGSVETVTPARRQ